jgi:chorismate synthase
MRILTAGESHGWGNAAILEGFPRGVKIEENFLNNELKRRMSGYGRGKRMAIEQDTARIVTGLRNKISLGSPITVFIENRDQKIFTQNSDNLPKLTIPRPAHADLAGVLKYGDNDVRNMLERASARETTAKVAIGAICKQFLLEFGVKIAGFTVSIGNIISQQSPENIEEIISKTKKSQLNCIDHTAEKLMIEEIDKADKDLDSLGGVVEVWIQGVVAGLGSAMHFDRRLDSQLAAYLMSIPAVKGMEIGLGFEYAGQRGSISHDSIFYSKTKGFYHSSNNSGGIEGGMSNGAPIVFRLAMKPIATLRKPLQSVNLVNKKEAKAIVERSDTCAVSACAVIAEAMAAMVITAAFLDKFGADSLNEIKRNYNGYIKILK